MGNKPGTDESTIRHRPLKVYAFDPSRGRTLGNYMTINVEYEDVQPGPLGKYVHVIDYDATHDCYYLPIDLTERKILIQGGIDPNESDPRFHQQMVYAVVSETIRRFEFALGRTIVWAFERRIHDEYDERKPLRIFPHAMQEANAYYDRDLEALLFGYFKASETDAGVNIPGQTIFTCLSHDIVVHEATHALVDSQRDFFMEATSPDAPAFHEAFADIVALFQHFSFKEALLEVIQQTGGSIFRSVVDPETQPANGAPIIQAELTADNPLVGLAKQFGDAMGTRKALRSALGTPPNTNDLKKYNEPHTRGSILVAAVFDAFFTVYVRRTRDLMRIARAGGARMSSGDLNYDLANRLAEIAAKTAEGFLNICIRALDYCPPVDIQLGDFLRAMVTADYDLVSDDKYGYRMALIQAFRSRGIHPAGVASYSEESLLWSAPEGLSLHCKGLAFDLFSLNPRQQRQKNGKALWSFAKKHAELFCLTIGPDIKIQARTHHEVHRVSPDGQIMFNVIAEITQSREVPIDPNYPNLGKFKFRGGTTLILDENSNVKYSIPKPMGYEKDDENNERLIRQRAYQARRESDMAFSDFSEERLLGPELVERWSKSLNMTHRGY
ncbi:MAG TPA: peptidase M4 [Blastocatellia bacterium]|nr:peptidase M4 [Blastocatellia bacterium]